MTEEAVRRVRHSWRRMPYPALLVGCRNIERYAAVHWGYRA